MANLKKSIYLNDRNHASEFLESFLFLQHQRLITIFQDLKMIEYLIMGACLILAYVYYAFWVKPKKEMFKVCQEFQKNGLKPYLFPYRPFEMTSFEILKDGEKKGDIISLYKKEFQGYDVVVGHFFDKVSIQLLSPDLIKEFCERERQWNYQKHEEAIRYLERVIGKGLLICEGEMWKKKRTAMSQVFQHNFVVSQVDKMIDSAEQAFLQAESIRDLNQATKPIQNSIKNFTTAFASKFVFRGFLGGNLNKEKINNESVEKLLKQLLDHAMDQFEDKVSMMLGTKFLSLGLRKKDKQFLVKMKLFNDWADEYTKTRLQEQKKIMAEQGDAYTPKDIISSLAYFQIKNPEKGQFKFINYVEELKTFFTGGMETTSSYLMTMIFLLYKNPAILEKLKKQIDENIKQTDFSYEHLKNMEYLDAVLKEALRIFGPVNGIQPRQVVKDHYLGGVAIKKGIFIEYFTMTSQFDQKYFKDPEAFRPQRWLNGQCDNFNQFTLMAFHGGPRACIGKQTAILQAKTALIMFIRRYKQVKVLADVFEGELGVVLWPKDYEVEVVKN